MRDIRQLIDVAWAPLKPGPNEPGPTDTAGEYRGLTPTAEDDRALSPEEIREEVQAPPIDIASASLFPPRPPDGHVDPAAEDFPDTRHLIRGQHHVASSKA